MERSVPSPIPLYSAKITSNILILAEYSMFFVKTAIETMRDSIVGRKIESKGLTKKH